LPRGRCEERLRGARRLERRAGRGGGLVRGRGDRRLRLRARAARARGRRRGGPHRPRGGGRRPARRRRARPHRELRGEDVIPSPSISALSLGPLTIHFYALCILSGIAVALWWATKRRERRGGDGDTLFDLIFVAVVARSDGSRLWLVTTP